MKFDITCSILNYKSCSKTAKIINLPYYPSHFIKKIHFLTLMFFLGPLTRNRPFFIKIFLNQNRLKRSAGYSSGQPCGHNQHWCEEPALEYPSR